MKKSSILILSIITAITLCGCETKQPDSSDNSSVENSSESSTAESSTDSTTESKPENSVPEETNETGEPLVLVGLDGKIISEEDITKILDGEWKEAVLSELTTDNFTVAYIDGVYVAPPTKICRTAEDNADVFDQENLVFTDLPKEHKTDDYTFIRVGDEICGLTVTYAYSKFDTDLSEVYGITQAEEPKIYYNQGVLQLDGEVELTGYLMVSGGTGSGFEEGDIFLIPSDCEIDLPVIACEFDPDEGFYHPVGELTSDYSNEYGRIIVGNIHSTDIDISGLPTDWSTVKARVTVSNIYMSCTMYGIAGYNVYSHLENLTIL